MITLFDIPGCAKDIGTGRCDDCCRRLDRARMIERRRLARRARRAQRSAFRKERHDA